MKALMSPSRTLILFYLLSGTLCLGQTISLSPKMGPPTTRTVISGNGFTPNASIRISFDGTKLTMAKTDASGSFSNVSIPVPATALPGRHRVTAAVAGDGSRAQTFFLVRTDWSQFRFNPDHSGFNPYENVLNSSSVGGMQIKWSYTTGGSVESSPAVVNGVAYVGSEDRHVYALNADTGTLLWSYSTADMVTSSPAVVNGVVYVASVDGNVYALDSATGHLVWNYSSGQRAAQYILGGVSSSPVVANGLVYFGSPDGTMYALQADTGSVQWAFQTSTSITSSPAVVNGAVYFAAFDYNFYALNATTGEQLWSYPIGGWTYSSAAVTNGVVYVGSESRGVLALDVSSGALLWTYIDAQYTETDASPAVANGVVYGGSQAHNLYALNAASGELVWTYNLGNSLIGSPVVANGLIYAAPLYYRLQVLDANTGSLLWQYSILEGWCWSSPAVVNGTVYIGWGDKLYAFGLPKSVNPAPLRDELKP